MKTKRRIARRWTPEQIDRFANDPDMQGASELAKRLGPLAWAIWNAEKDPNLANAEAETATISSDLGSEIRPVS